MAAQEMGVRSWWFLSFCCSSFLTHCCSMGSSTGHSPFRVVLSPVPPLHPCSSGCYPGISPASARLSLLFLRHLSLPLCCPSCPGIFLFAPSGYHSFLNKFSQRHHRLLWLVEVLVGGGSVCRLQSWLEVALTSTGVPDLLLHRSPQQPFATPNPACYAQCRCLAIFIKTFFSVMLLICWFYVCVFSQIDN